MRRYFVSDASILATAFSSSRVPTKTSTSKPLGPRNAFGCAAANSRRRRVHFNQYRDEYQQMKRANASHAPFSNDPL
jgi:hypothetical protein